MLARKCDICGKFHEFNYSEDFNAIKLIDARIDGNLHSAGFFDLCPECAGEIKKLMENRMENKDGKK